MPRKTRKKKAKTKKTQYDIKVLEKEHDTLISEISELKAEYQSIPSDLIDAQKRIKDIQAVENTHIESLAREKQKLSDEILLLEQAKMEADKKLKVIQKSDNLNKDKEVELKTLKESLKNKEAELNRVGTKLKREKKSHDKDVADFKAEKEFYMEKIRLTGKEYIKAINSSREINELEKKLEAKINESMALNIRLKNVLRENEMTRDRYLNQEAINKDIRGKLTIKVGEQNQRDKKQDSRDKELNAKHEFIERKRLRIEKLARDKGVVKELEAFEKKLGEG